MGPKRELLDEIGNFQEFVADGGQAIFTFNAEIRQRFDRFIKGFGGALFVDGGQIWRRPQDITFFAGGPFVGEINEANYSGLQFSGGVGFSYRSPIGPIRFDIAMKLNPDRSDLDEFGGTPFRGDLRRFNFHLSIGQVF